MFNDQGYGGWHRMFNACANSLHWAAKKLDPYWPGGMDYVKINVILFCLILPVVLVVSLGLNVVFILRLLCAIDDHSSAQESR